MALTNITLPSGQYLSTLMLRIRNNPQMRNGRKVSEAIFLKDFPTPPDSDLQVFGDWIRRAWGIPEANEIVAYQPALLKLKQDEFEQLPSDEMKVQIREWLSDRSLIRVGRNPMDRLDYNRCGGNKVQGFHENSHILAPNSLSRTECGKCSTVAINDVATNSQTCIYCGRSTADTTIYNVSRRRLQSIATITTPLTHDMYIVEPVCGSCVGGPKVIVRCWNCSKPTPNDESRPFHNSYRMTSPYGIFEVVFCEDCNYVGKNGCGWCGGARGKIGFDDPLDGTHYGLCHQCATKVVGRCNECKTSHWDFNLQLVECAGYDDDDNPLGKKVCHICQFNRPSCLECGARVDSVTYKKFGGYCKNCVSSSIEGNVQYYRANVLEYVSPRGRANRKMGVEIELEWKGVSGSKPLVNKLDELTASLRNYGIIKRDGSLDAGIEFVTTPMSLDIHQNGCWDMICEKLGKDYEPQPTCGIHVHVSRAGLNGASTARLLKLVYYNPSFWVRVAGRESAEYASIRGINYSDLTHDRYVALNLMNPETVEFRIFKASTDSDYILSRIELCEAAVRFVGSKGIGANDTTIKRFYQYVRANRRRYPKAIKLFRSGDWVRGEQWEVNLSWPDTTTRRRRRRRARQSRIRQFGSGGVVIERVRNVISEFVPSPTMPILEGVTVELPLSYDELTSEPQVMVYLTDTPEYSTQIGYDYYRGMNEAGRRQFISNVAEQLRYLRQTDEFNTTTM